MPGEPSRGKHSPRTMPPSTGLFVEPDRFEPIPMTRQLVLRIAGLLALTLLAYGGVFQEITRSISEGSRSSYLMVMPVLLAMIAYGRAHAPRGVSDGETDWILAIGFGGLALVLSSVAAQRFPTLAGLWGLGLVSAVIWSACAAIILFGTARVKQMRSLLVFALLTVTPLPWMLLTAALGGTTFAAAAVATGFGAVAVFLAGWHSPFRLRVAASVGCVLVGLGAAWVLSGFALPIPVGVTAGIIPVLGFAVLQRLRDTGAGSCTRDGVLASEEGSGKDTIMFSSGSPTPLPHRSKLALLAITVVAGAHLLFTTSASAAVPAAQLAHADATWASRAGFVSVQQFSFVQRFLGPESTFVRYQPPSLQGPPAVAIDVITADNLEVLRTSQYVVWHPAPSVVSYRMVDVGSVIKEALVSATDSSAATTGGNKQWYTVSWLWGVAETFQQVFVIVNQDVVVQDPPPLPVPPTFRSTVVDPFLWFTRQQADPSTLVDAAVRGRAQAIVDVIVAAAQVRHD